MAAPRPDYGISRIDQPEKKNHGWNVRVTHKGKMHQKYFPDKTWKGKANALREARRFRDALLKKLPKAKQESASRKRRKVKQSGVVGVTHVVSKANGKNSYEYWQGSLARWAGTPPDREILDRSLWRQEGTRSRQRSPSKQVWSQREEEGGSEEKGDTGEAGSQKGGDQKGGDQKGGDQKGGDQKGGDQKGGDQEGGDQAEGGDPAESSSQTEDPEAEVGRQVGWDSFVAPKLMGWRALRPRSPIFYLLGRARLGETVGFLGILG